MVLDHDNDSGMEISQRRKRASTSLEKDRDPHNSNRFLNEQSHHHPQALKELKVGHKTSCWSWYILPTPPFIRKHARDMARHGTAWHSTHAC